MKTKKQTAKEIGELLAGAGDVVVHILPDGTFKVLDADPAIDKGYNAGVEAARLWHVKQGKAFPKNVHLHDRYADSIRKLKR